MFTIIRPRAGDFFYDDDEFHQMKKDITVCKNLKVDGVVFGILNIDLSVDIKRNKELVEHAKPMCSTFHRAFDETINAEQALEDIISCGFQRILTSGHQATAEKGADEISKLISLAGNRIIIMPGGDVRSSNIDFLLQKTGAKEFHSSARIDMEINESEIVRMKAYISH
jgi:copper homeostasis protein